MLTLKTASTIAELEAVVPQWEALAGEAVEPNPFFEPWVMLPPLRHFHARDRFLVLLLYDADRLVGFFPFRIAIWPRRVGVLRKLALFRYHHCSLCTPLIHRDYLPETISAVLTWHETSRHRTDLLEFTFMSGDGPVSAELHRQLRALNAVVTYEHSIERSFCEVPSDVDAYLGAALSNKSLGKIRRQERRLSEQGNFAERHGMLSVEETERWVDAYLTLESSGWKGEAGSSFGATEERRTFFHDVMLDGARLGRVRCLGLYLDEKPVALACQLMAGGGVFGFRMSYDEEYRNWSPGRLLAIKDIQWMREAGIQWLDSCADQNHALGNWIWVSRRKVETVGLARRHTRAALLIWLSRQRWAAATHSRLARVTDRILPDLLRFR